MRSLYGDEVIRMLYYQFGDRPNTFERIDPVESYRSHETD